MRVPKLSLMIPVWFFLGASLNTQAATVLARSADDWDNAAVDGIGTGGGAVTPGSVDDAPQQGHADTEGSGSWRYHMTQGLVGGSFSGAPVEPIWNGTGLNGAGFYDANARKLTRNVTAPNSTASGRRMVNREWTGSDLMGQTLRIFGSFSTLTNTAPHNATNNGVRVGVAVDGLVMFEEQMAPGTESFFDFEITVTSDDPFVRFGVGPQGPIAGAGISNDFFNDAVVFSGEIHVVPLPAPILLLLSGMLAMIIPKVRT